MTYIEVILVSLVSALILLVFSLISEAVEAGDDALDEELWRSRDEGED
jgi:hypothetical protein